MVDCSIGTPCDPPLRAVVDALASSGTERGYPASAGSAQLREAAAAWLARRFELADVPVSSVAACVGTKELVASVPHVLRLREPERDTVLYPAVSYPTYAMGAELAGCRAVPVPPRPGRLGGLDLDAIDPADAERALVLWSNSPSNPTGGLGDLGAEAAWGRAHGVPVFSDECYAEFTWDGPPRSVLQHGRRRCGRRALALEAFEPGRRARRLLRRGRRAGRVPAGRAPARRPHGPGPGAGRRRRGPGRRRPRGGPAGALPRAPGLPGRCPGRLRLPGHAPRGRASTCGSRCRPTVGPTPGPWPRRWPPTAGCWSAPATSTGRAAPATSGWRSCSRWSGWRWWGSASVG